MEVEEKEKNSSSIKDSQDKKEYLQINRKESRVLMIDFSDDEDSEESADDKQEEVLKE